MKKSIITLNILALIVALFWLFKTDFDFEPLIVCITLIATLIGLLFKDKIMSKNIAKIEGDENKVNQTKTKSDKSENKVVIKGNKNKVKQK